MTHLGGAEFAQRDWCDLFGFQVEHQEAFGLMDEQRKPVWNIPEYSINFSNI